MVGWFNFAIVTLFCFTGLNVAYHAKPFFRYSLTSSNDADVTRCLDGSEAVLYYSEGHKRSRDLLLYLQPGGYCTSDVECKLRCQLAPFLCEAPETAILGDQHGLLSGDPEVNPHFRKFHRVIVPYCSGDMFAGRQTWLEADGWPDNRLAFHGKRILHNVIATLKSMTSASSFERVVLAGSSAGGAGVVFNCDGVASLFEEAKMFCVVDGAFFYPINAQELLWRASGGDPQVSRQKDVCTDSLDEVLQASRLWGAPEVASFNLDSDWWIEIKHPLLITSALIDQFGFESFCGKMEDTQQLRQWTGAIYERIARMTKQTTSHVSLFLPSCFDHVLLTDDVMFSKVKVGSRGMTLQETMWHWVNSERAVHVFDWCEDGQVLCNPLCANVSTKYNAMDLN